MAEGGARHAKVIAEKREREKKEAAERKKKEKKGKDRHAKVIAEKRERDGPKIQDLPSTPKPTQTGPTIKLNDSKAMEKAAAQKQSVEAFNRPFKDPKGFLKDAFSPSTLKETIPLALGAGGQFATEAALSGGFPRLGQTATSFGGDALAGADEAVNAIIPTVRSGQGGILGKYVLGQGAKAIEVAKTTFTATAPRTATQTISKVGEMAINTKTIGLSKSLLGKVFSGKAMATYGAWVSSLFLGRWGQAEAPEAILIPIKDLMKQAETPEDWAVVNEHLKLAEELSNTSTWEDIILWSPFSAVKGIMDKVRGVAEGVKILEETAIGIQDEAERVSEQGGSDFDVAQEERDAARDERDAEFAQSEEDRNTRQDERDEKFTADQEARDAAKEREARILQEVFRLRRAKKYDEADALELTIFE